MRPTKLGVHHMLGGGDTRRWTAVATGLVCVGDYGAALEAPAGVHVLGRALDDGKLWGQGFDMNRHCLQEGRSAHDMARYFFEYVLREPIARNPKINRWLGPNEQIFIWSQEYETPGHPQYDPARAAQLQADRERVMRWYSVFLYALARLLWFEGKRLVFGNWSYGHPHKEWNLWRFYTPALQAGRDYGAWHADHAYGPHDEDHALRYRWNYREFARLGYPDITVALTECGAEDAGGMKPWRVQYGGDVHAYFNRWVKPFALALEDDDYVALAALFTCGRGGEAWADYEVTGTGLVDLVVDWCERRDPLPPLGEQELSQMTPEELQAVAASSQIIETEAGKIKAIAQKYLAPAPWWHALPEGLIHPARRLKVPPAPIQIYQASGQPFNPPKLRQNGMDVTERRGNLLRVWDAAEPAPDWYVRAEDVQPDA
jgi:hypothetical protein